MWHLMMLCTGWQSASLEQLLLRCMRLPVCAQPLLQIWIGGNKNQTRMAELYADRIKVRQS